MLSAGLKPSLPPVGGMDPLGFFLVLAALAIGGGLATLFLRGNKHLTKTHAKEGVPFAILMAPFVLYVLAHAGFRISLSTLFAAGFVSLVAGWVLFTRA